MSWRDRIAAEAAKAKDKLGEELTGLVAGPDGQASPEGFVLGLVRTARDPVDESLTHKQVHKEAKKRHRRLGLASFAAGPFAGAAAEATDLYTETATVCDLVELHDLTLSDVDIGAHMLVLWGITDDFAHARAALDGSGQPLTALLSRRYLAELRDEDEKPTATSIVQAIWKQRQLHDELLETARRGSVKRVLRAGAHTKEFLARAETQLGLRPS